jgi:predicted nucleic acid-binding protein
MSRYTALYDACVLYPAPLRDLLVQLALTDTFRARWTAKIHDEWMRNVLRDRPDLTPDDLYRTRDLMDSHIRDCLITDYEPLIDTLVLPDQDDRHVLAAAIRGRVDVIVTYNLKDFKPIDLKPYDIEAQHPDEFIAHLIDLAPTAVLGAAKIVRARLKNPPLSPQEYLDRLSQQQLSITVDFLTEGISLI